MSVPTTNYYRDSHEWISAEGEERLVGITDHAQEELTEIVYVELPKVGKKVNAGDPVAVVESVKAASDIYAPVAGTVTAVNDALESDPGLINTSPHDKGWIYKLTPSGDVCPGDGLLTAAEYEALIH